MNIKNIIFDLGNVILNIDTKLSEIEFAKHGLSDFNSLYSLAKQTEIFDRLEIGVISPEEFCDEFRILTNTQLSDSIIENCWNALIMDFPVERIELLKNIKKDYRTFILSNTNEIHYKHYTNILKTEFHIKGLEELVEKAYFSHQIGMKKPNHDIFEYVLNLSGLIPAETLFIDDNYDNIYAAEQIGLETIWLKNNDLVDKIRNSGLI